MKERGRSGWQKPRTGLSISGQQTEGGFTLTTVETTTAVEVFPNIRSAKGKKRKEIVGIIGKSGAAFTFGLASMIIGGETPIPEFETKTYLERLLSVWLYVKLGFYGAGVALFLKANSLKEREALARKQLDYLKSLAQ